MINSEDGNDIQSEFVVSAIMDNKITVVVLDETKEVGTLDLRLIFFYTCMTSLMEMVVLTSILKKGVRQKENTNSIDAI